MQIQTALWNDYTCIRMTTIKNPDHTQYDEDIKKLKLSYLVVGM